MEEKISFGGGERFISIESLLTINKIWWADKAYKNKNIYVHFEYFFIVISAVNIAS